MEYVLVCFLLIAFFFAGVQAGVQFEQIRALGFIRRISDAAYNDAFKKHDCSSKRCAIQILIHSSALMCSYYGDYSLDKKLLKYLEDPENDRHTLINKSHTKKGHEKCHKRRQDDPRK